MKRKQQINIDSVTFDLKGCVKATHLLTVGEKDLSDVYKRPSATKQAIHRGWLKWAVNNSGYLMIRSYNANVFTLHGSVIYEGVKYYIEIFPTHNDAYIIEDWRFDL